MEFSGFKEKKHAHSAIFKKGKAPHLPPQPWNGGFQPSPDYRKEGEDQAKRWFVIYFFERTVRRCRRARGVNGPQSIGNTPPIVAQ
jgi:hypothetical protein